MNYLRKMRKNAKALSPVVASIILIAVTVAVSIAVAAWMGGLAGGFMQTEQLSITNVQFNTLSNGTKTIDLAVSNTGTTDVTISSATVNGVTTNPAVPVLVGKNAVGTITLTYTWTTTSNYQIKLVSAKGNSFQYSAIAV